MSSKCGDLTVRDHPADDPEQIEVLRLALAVHDIEVARLVGLDVLARREAWCEAKQT